MSDSESDYDIDVGLTSVLLGFAGKEAIYDDLSIHGNHVGGLPLWFGTEKSPILPKQELLECKVCKKSLDLLAQLSCPLPDKFYDRVIYIFSCADPNCRRKEGSVRAIRGIDNSQAVQDRIAQEMKAQNVEENLVPESKIGDSLFSASSSTNPFASNANPFASAQAPPTSQPSNSGTPRGPKKSGFKKKSMRSISGKYTCKLLDVEEEYLESLDKPLDSNIKIEEMDTYPEESPAGSDPSGGDVADIKGIEANSNPVFTHFMDVIESNPDQVLRYELGLKPLLYSGTDEVARELSHLGDKHKRLEVQLMPHLITELETVEMLLDGMEWGTIFVACDSDDDLSSLNENGIGYAEEWVGVQWE